MIDPTYERARQLVAAVAVDTLDLEDPGDLVEEVMSRHGDAIVDMVYGLAVAVLADNEDGDEGDSAEGDSEVDGDPTYEGDTDE